MDFSLDGSLLHLLHRASQLADDIFASHPELDGLTSRQFIVLAAISAREGASQTDITEMTGVDRSTLTDLIARLQGKGMVARNRSQHDARSYEVRLTAAGRKALAVAMPIAQSVDKRLLGGVPVRAQRDAAGLLQAIVTNGPNPIPGRSVSGR